MITVPIGKLILHVTESEDREAYLRGLIWEMQKTVRKVVQRCIKAELEQEVTRFASTDLFVSSHVPGPIVL